MKWLPALFIGAILGFVLPMALGGQAGVWMNSWAKWGTIRPVEGSPGLLFSIPVALGSALALRLFFNWHSR
jgi:ethanolamine transporter EutH